MDYSKLKLAIFLRKDELINYESSRNNNHNPLLLKY